MTTSVEGLREVKAAHTSITWIDREQGELRYRGYPIGDLALVCGFEDVVWLLRHGELPTARERETLLADLAASREEAVSWVLPALAGLPIDRHPLSVLRYLVSLDALRNPLAEDKSPEANERKADQFTAWFPLAVATYHRLAAGKAAASHAGGDTAGYFLTLLHDREPADVTVSTLDISLVLHADHEFNASTFAARVTIATQSTIHDAVASALGTLAGPRHGGASDRVIAMLQAIDAEGDPEAWTLHQLARHERIMGFGHPVYQTTDPRARHLRDMASRLLAGTPHERWIEHLDVVAGVVERERGRFPDVDLYAALVNHELGIAPAFYSAVFACSRIAGWTAHAMEQVSGRLMRPVGEYVGPDLRRMALPFPLER